MCMRPNQRAPLGCRRRHRLPRLQADLRFTPSSSRLNPRPSTSGRPYTLSIAVASSCIENAQVKPCLWTVLWPMRAALRCRCVHAAADAMYALCTASLPLPLVITHCVFAIRLPEPGAGHAAGGADCSRCSHLQRRRGAGGGQAGAARPLLLRSTGWMASYGSTKSLIS